MFPKTPYKRALLYSAMGTFALLAALAVFLPGYRLMIAFFAYTATLNSGVIPFPTMTFAIFLGKTHSPFLVAVVGMLGSVISSIIVYYLGIKLSNNKRVRQIENSGFIKGCKTLACRLPFLSLVVFNTVPLPVEPSRFFAILNRYSVKRYITAISLGRFVRYFLLAVLGEAFRIPNSVLIALTIMLIISPFLVRKCKKQSKKLLKSRPSRRKMRVFCCQIDKKPVELQQLAFCLRQVYCVIRKGVLHTPWACCARPYSRRRGAGYEKVYLWYSN